LTIIKGAVVSRTVPQALLLYGPSQVWLLDTLQPLSSILVTWPTPLGTGHASVLQIATELVDAQNGSHGPDEALYHKASAALVEVCAEFLQNHKPLLAEDEDGVSLRRAFCFAFIELAKAAAEHAPTSRLIASGLLASVQRLASEHSIAGDGTDIWVSFNMSPDFIFVLIAIQRTVHLLTAVATPRSVEEPSEKTNPSMFVDVELRQQVQKLALQSKTSNFGIPLAKRRKLNGQERELWVELASQLSRLVDADLDGPVDELEGHIMFVAPVL
jgi:serine/threonine-protein kinase ATR